MRVIIAGSRKFANYDLLKTTCINCLKELKDKGYRINRKSIEIVSGKARGADRLGERFAHECELNLVEMPAQWDKYGKKAGHIRNRQMATYAEQDDEVGVLIAFWDGKSPGTKSMINIAREYGLQVYVTIQ